MSALSDSSSAKPLVVVVGSGLSGLSASLEIANEARVLLLEQDAKLGGNSTMASSGINSITPDHGDAVGDYEADVLKSGGGLSSPDLVRALVGDSAEALEFLTRTGVDLSNVVQLGGHSHARTHRNPSGPNVGFAIMSPLMAAVSAHPDIEVRTACRVVRLLLDDSHAVCGVQCHCDGADGDETVRARAVILCTGGFGASQAALQRWSPKHVGMPSTNRPCATGDGMLIAHDAGASLVDLDWVQVHPTGFVDPAAPSAPTKFLAPEALRGSGAVLLDASGARFVDELATRAAVVAAMAEVSGPVWLLLSAEGAALFGVPALEFYQSRGLMRRVDGVEAAAQHMGLPADKVREELRRYNLHAERVTVDPFGKTVFPSKFEADGVLWAARVTPVVHYCMGGVKINERGEALDAAGKPVAGLFAAGEATGGLHGKNRLAGNSLLDCVVFGRRAARSAGQFARAAVA